MPLLFNLFDVSCSIAFFFYQYKMSVEQIRLNKYMFNANIALCLKFTDDEIEIEAR